LGCVLERLCFHKKVSTAVNCLRSTSSFIQTSVRRSFATVVNAGPSSAASSSTPASQSEVVDNEQHPPNLIFQDGEVDITDSVLKMLEQDQSECASLTRWRRCPCPDCLAHHRPGLAGFSKESYDVSYLPLSSLASDNARLPAPQVRGRSAEQGDFGD
jgi:hypothetical protein